jgi:FkbM family methyltransferase
MSPNQVPLVEKPAARRSGGRTEFLANGLWTSAVVVRNWLKRVGMLGPLEGVLARIGPRLLPPPTSPTTVTLPLGLAMKVPPASPSYRNFAAGVYERDVTALVLSLISGGMTFLDLGASIGYYTLLASRLTGPAGRVFAFEPDSEAYEYLEHNVQANRLENVVAVRKAVTNRSVTMSFTRPELERGFLINASTGVGTGVGTVDTVSLDDFFRALGWPRVDLIKLDIEGSESSALWGMAELLERNRGVRLIMELNADALTRAGSSVTELVTTLKKLAFSKAFLIERRREVAVEGLIRSTAAVHNLLLTPTAS